MCVGDMTSSPYQSMSCFLESFNNKRSVNKRRADPDMRMEALLGTACKRMKVELQREGTAPVCAEEVKSVSVPSNATEDASVIARGLLDQSRLPLPFASLDDVATQLYGEPFSNGKHGSSNDKFPLNDPEQVAAFFRQVDASPDDRMPDDPSGRFTVNISQEQTQTVADKPISDQELVDILLSYEVEEFASQFDTLYDRVLYNLSSVEQCGRPLVCLCNDSEGIDCYTCKKKGQSVDLAKEMSSGLTGTA